MAWLEITLQNAGHEIEDIAAQLTARGFSDLVIEDEQEFEAFLEDNREYWDYIDEDLQEKLTGLSCIKLYLEDTDSENLAKIRAFAEEKKLPMEACPMEETDWEESWKDNYPPVNVGENLVVVPYWLEGDFDGRKKVILDPGLTFGTGAHPSTQMVMANMEKLVKKGDACLDLGSGSGILSITALRLGAKSAVGVDIDPKAEDIARENAAYNGFAAPEFTALTGNVTEDKALMHKLSEGHYDMVLVNIVADVIIGLSPVLKNFMDEKTVLVCSGILDVRLTDVLEALKKGGMDITSVHESGDWRCVVARLKK